MSKPETTPAPTTAQGEARRGEGVIVVMQNNADKTLTISAMNPMAEQLLGYGDGETKGRKFEAILGPHTAEYLAEEIEYTDDAPDLGEVLARQREIRLRQRTGQELTTNCTVTRLMSQGMNACFQLVIPNEHERAGKQKIRDFLRLNLEGRAQIDPATGLPNRATAEEFVPLLKNYLAESDIPAVFAVLRIDRHKKNVARYGQEPCIQLLKHAANCCRSTFRTEDLVFALSDHTLGLMLFDISRESARVVLNRLRGNIREHRILFGDKSSFSVTTSIAFDVLDAERGDGLFARCDDAIGALDEEERNSLIEIGN